MKNILLIILFYCTLFSSNSALAEIVYVHNDALGSPIMETNESGVVIERFHYKPFGETLEEMKEGVGYTGHLNDTDLGLTYMQARYYDPVIGRFYSNDPVRYTAKNPVMSFNRYLYVNNNPYKYTDPTGMYLTADKKDRKKVLKWINSQGKSKYKFNSSGYLQKIKGGKGGGKSESFSKAIDSIIASDKMGVHIYIRDTTPRGKSVDDIYGGGATDTMKNGSSEVFMSGNSNTLNGVDSTKITLSPAEILVHELVDHVLPNFTSKGGYGTGYTEVNKVRKENDQHLIGSNPHHN